MIVAPWIFAPPGNLPDLWRCGVLFSGPGLLKERFRLAAASQGGFDIFGLLSVGWGHLPIVFYLRSLELSETALFFRLRQFGDVARFVCFL